MVSTAGQDQRRHPRLKTRKIAQFIYAGLVLSCEIRDYCLNGLFLSFADPSALEALLPHLAGAPAQIEFAAATSKGHRFLINANVAHISPGGLGLHVDQMPAGAAQALHAAALAGEGVQAVPHQNLDPEVAKAMQQECNNLFRSFLDAVLQEFFSQAPARLTQASDELSSFIERSIYVQASQTLNQRKVPLQEAFFNTIREHIQRIGQSEEDAQDGEQDAESTVGGLSLIDDEEFQDWLNLSAAINEVELAASTELAVFERGYSVLIGTALPRKRNPFTPELLCHCLRDVIQSLEFGNAMRAILYRTFSQALIRHISDLYQQLNQVLAPLQPAAPAKRKKKEVKPEASESDDRIAADPVHSEQDTSTATNTATNTAMRPNQEQASQPPAAPVAMSAQENGDYSLDRILSSINQPARSSASGSRFRAADVPVAAWMPSVPGRRPNLAEIASRLHQTSRQIGAGQPAGVASETILGGLPEASQRELLAALNSLPLAQTPPSSGVASVLSEQVQAWLAATGGKPTRIAPAYRQALDTTAGLIERARAEYVDSSQVELLLRRLERPLLKLAIENEDFLLVSDHPARQVVNLLDQFALAADDQGCFFDPKLHHFLARVVDRICTTVNEDPGIYATVRDSLSKMLAPIRQARGARVARLQESYAARERLRQARARVVAALETRFAGRDVPELLPRLLNAGWRQYLVLLEMREGMGGEEWDAGLGLLDQLVSELAASGDRPLEALPLLNRIETRLASVNVDAVQRATLIADLAAGLRGEAEAAPMFRYPLPAKAVAASEDTDETAAQRRLSEQVRVGEWWEFSLDGRWVPMQCIWISSPPANCAFANRSASDKLELALPELSRQMRGGLARVGGNLDVPLLDRSEFALFDDTYHGLLRQVHRDSVTGLVNREGFLLRLGQIAAESVRQGLKVHSLCILEFDQFRLISNQHGPEAGETLSRQLAEELRKRARPVDVLARFHEDTFALYLPNLALSDAERLADGLLRQLGDYRYQHGNDSYSIGLNLGLAEFAPALVSIAEAIRRADSACLTAKTLGRNRIQTFEPSNVQLNTQESLMGLAGRIDALMENGGLYLRAQMVMPISADTGLLPYYEILLGITGDDGLFVAPMLFIPAIEGLKRSHEIDIWVVKQVFAWIRTNREIFASIGGFSINLSALSLSNSVVLDFLLDQLAHADLPTDKLVFEITETAAIENYNVARDFIRQVSGYGCKFSLDDFGSGYSSYSHLKNLKTHSLKIDGSFVKEMIQNSADFAIVKSMNDIGHSLGMKTVAEYVESAEILSKLREIGVDYAQGFIIHQPERIEHLDSRRQT